MINQNAESEVGKKRTSKRGFWTDTVWCVGCDSHILPGFPWQTKNIKSHGLWECFKKARSILQFNLLLFARSLKWIWGRPCKLTTDQTISGSRLKHWESRLYHVTFRNLWSLERNLLVVINTDASTQLVAYVAYWFSMVFDYCNQCHDVPSTKVYTTSVYRWPSLSCLPSQRLYIDTRV